MEKISRETLVKRAINWSLLQKKYKDYLGHCRFVLEFSRKRKMENIPSLWLTTEEARKQIEKCRRLTINNFSRLLYDDLVVPPDDSKKKMFGEVSTNEFYDEIIENSIYHTVDYISSDDLKRGYVELIELEQDIISVNQRDMIINLTTGEYVRATPKNVAKCESVTLVLDKLVRNPANY